jgi:tRNA threonylcarbamoyladenosine biosynthesis protein TsaB
MELALDTSSKINSIAISREGEILNEMVWQSSHNETVELIPNLIHLLKQSRLEADLLQTILVAIGPGRFNSLRVGLGIAKGMAFSLDIPLISVSTLNVMAYPFANTKLQICPIQQASHNTIATATYQQSNTWYCIKPAHLTTLELLCQQVDQQTLFCGEINGDMANIIEHNLGHLAVIPKIPEISHTASLAALGWKRFINGKQDNIATLQPLYLRPPHITEPRKKNMPTAQHQSHDVNPDNNIFRQVE